MKISIGGLCRGRGMVFIKVGIIDFDPNYSVRFSSRASTGKALPCLAYQIEEDPSGSQFVIVISSLDITQTIAAEQHDSSGKLFACCSKKISSFRAKWESRFNYKVKPQMTVQLRDYDERYRYDQACLYIWSCLESNSCNIIRGTLGLPQGFSQENVCIECLDENGENVMIEPIFLGSESYHPIPFSSYTINNIEISICLPKKVQNYCLSLSCKDHPEQNAFSVLEKTYYANLLDDSKKLTQSAQGDSRYHSWFIDNKVKYSDVKKQATAHFEIKPVFSIVVPLYKTPLPFLCSMVQSVLEQSYVNWELILVNASPEDKALSSAISNYAEQDERVRIVSLEENGGISKNTNAGIEVAKGSFVCFFDHDDLIEPNLLFEYTCAINTKEGTEVLYCDEDKLGEDGIYFDPFFKPDFNLDLLRNNNYICHLLCIKKSLMDQIGLLDPTCDGAQDHDLTLRAAEKASHIYHVDKILYHWRVSAQSTAGNAASKSYATESGITAVRKHLERLDIPALVEPSRRPFTYKVTYLLPEEKPLVSIVIPNKDNRDVLKTCIDSILTLSTYTNFEIIIVENNSEESGVFDYYAEIESDTRIRVLTHDGPFNFSRIINEGVEAAKGEYFILLNNDTEVITPDWIERMLGICLRNEVGIVGVKLYYPNETIQHAGISITPIIAGRLYAFLPRDNWGYFALNDAEQNLSAVTAACLMTKKSAYKSVDGFNEDLAVAFNDLDYCLKIRDKNLLVVYTPEVELYHHESLSRGQDNTETKQLRFEREVAYMRSRWAKYYINGDPYYNKNLQQIDPTSPAGALYFKLDYKGN